MAKMIGDPPGFERSARKGTPQDHTDQGHVVATGDGGWHCVTCDDTDEVRYRAEMFTTLWGITLKAHRAGVLDGLDLDDRERALLDRL